MVAWSALPWALHLVNAGELLDHAVGTHLGGDLPGGLEMARRKETGRSDLRLGKPVESVLFAEGGAARVVRKISQRETAYIQGWVKQYVPLARIYNERGSK